MNADFVIGGPDRTLTGTRPGISLDGLACDNESPLPWGAICTREIGHDGRHAAGTGLTIVETWA